MTKDIREKVADQIREEIADAMWRGSISADKLTEAILAIPEIANGLQLITANVDMLLGSSFVRITRIAPEDVYVDPPE